MKAKIVNGKVDIIDYDFESKIIEDAYQYNLTKNSVTDNVMNAILQKHEDMRTLDDMEKIILRKQIDDARNEALAKFSDYKELVVENYVGEVKEYERLDPVFEDIGDVIKQTYKPVVHEQFIKEIIKKCKDELTETDYIIVKSYEAKLTMADAPYTQDEIDKVVEKRQSLRDKVNELQDLLESQK